MPPQVLRPDHKSFQKIVYPWLQVSLMHAFEKLDPLPTITYPYLPSAAKRPGLSFFLLGTRFYETFEARLLSVTGQDVMVCIWGSKAQDSETIGDAVLNYGLEWHPDDYIDRFITNLMTERDDGEGVEVDENNNEKMQPAEELVTIGDDFFSGRRDKSYDQGGEDEFSPLKKGEQIKSINELQTMVHAGAEWNRDSTGDEKVNLRERLGALQNMWNWLDKHDLRLPYGNIDPTDASTAPSLEDRSGVVGRFDDRGNVVPSTQRSVDDDPTYRDRVRQAEMGGYEFVPTPQDHTNTANGIIDALQDLKDSLPHFPFGIVPRNMFDMLRPGLPDLGVYERVVLLNITKSK